MDSWEYKVSCHGRFHCHFKCLLVTNFSHHDYIRILSQCRSKSWMKGISNICSYLWLVETRHFIFDWIFVSNNISFDSVNFIQGCIKCCSLSRTCRSSIEQDSIWIFKVFFNCYFIRSNNSKLIKRWDRFWLIHDTHYEFFSPNCR